MLWKLSFTKIENWVLGRHSSKIGYDGSTSLKVDFFPVRFYMCCLDVYDWPRVPQVVALDGGAVREFSCFECFYDN